MLESRAKMCDKTLRTDNSECGASLVEALLLNFFILLFALSAVPLLTGYITQSLLSVEMAFSAGGTTRTGGTDFCADNPRHANCLSSNAIPAGPP